jgi:hypothetical protein
MGAKEEFLAGLRAAGGSMEDEQPPSYGYHVVLSYRPLSGGIEGPVAVQDHWDDTPVPIDGVSYVVVSESKVEVVLLCRGRGVKRLYLTTEPAEGHHVWLSQRR